MASTHHLHRRAYQILRDMKDNDADTDGYEPEIVHAEGDRFAWYKEDRITQGTLNTLLNCLAISKVSTTGEQDRYAINEVGMAIVERPKLASEVYWHLATSQGPFRIRNGHIQRLKGARHE